MLYSMIFKIISPTCKSVCVTLYFFQVNNYPEKFLGASTRIEPPQVKKKSYEKVGHDCQTFLKPLLW